MEWLRWYHGACSDAKWPIIARKAKVNVGVVVSVWAALLEYASQDEERGSVAGFDGETYDALYGYEDGTCDAVLEAMTEKGLICDGCICSWRKRQVQREREDSTNAERQRRHREQKKQKNTDENVETNASVTPRNASVTPRNASVTPPEQNRTEQRREENTHTPQDDLNNLNTRARALDLAGEVCGGEGSSPELEQASFRDRPKTDAPSKGNPQWPGFLSCFEVYPVKQGKEAAWREWMRLHQNGTLAPAYAIREAILRLSAEDSRWRRGMAPKMDKWLYGKGWEDEPYMPPGAEAVAEATVDEINAQAQRAAEERRKTFAALREESERMRYRGWTRQAATAAGGVQ